MLYAITDIETTGSHASGNSITEIGICLHDGERIVREWHTLLNVGAPLPRYITALTGITSEMLEGAPTFADIADVLHELLEDTVFVAHNVQFDYSFIRAEFAAAGIKWQSRRLCTIKLARKAFPGAPSYALGNICNWLAIHNEQAHRALTDARAAAQVFAKATAVLDDDVVEKMISRGAPEIFLPPNLNRADYDALPEKPGVYYMLNEKGKPIYIGKAKNLKKRVQQHFTARPEAQRLQDFMREIRHVSYELTGTELIALLLEDHEIRQHWPRHNAAQKNRVNHQAIISYNDHKGYMRLANSAARTQTAAVKTFTTAYRAKEWLMKMATEFEIDMRLLGLDMFDVHAAWPDVDEHNHLLQQAIDAMQKREPSLAVRGSGRTPDEVSYIVVRQGRLMGYAFVSREVSDFALIESCVNKLPPTETNASIMRQLIENPEHHSVVRLDNLTISQLDD
ncbi:MAG: exonuclease domain-containing protein [Flavobacteriales bacterium]